MKALLFFKLTGILSVLLMVGILFYERPNTTVNPADRGTFPSLDTDAVNRQFSLHGLGFEPFVGQWPVAETNPDADQLFRYKANNGLAVYLTGSSIVYQFKGPENEANTARSNGGEPSLSSQYTMVVRLTGSNTAPTVWQQHTGSVFQYYKPDSLLKAELSEVVTYKEVYSGIDWRIFIKDGKVKHEFIVHPHANPNDIQMEVLHAVELKVLESGELLMQTPYGEVREEKPVSFQNAKPVATQFVLHNNRVSFSIEKYSATDTLIIDPTLLWATYYGGNNDDAASSTAVDGDGNVYIAGTTESAASMASGGFDNSLGGTHDAYLAKFNSNGVLQWATYYGGTDEEYGLSCTVDAISNVFLAGYTYTTTGIGSGGHQNTFGGGTSSDAFLVKFNSSGTRQWATYYGGNAGDIGYACCTDASGNVYLGGSTSSTANISTAGAHATVGGTNCGFIVKFNSSGTRQWGTYYGYVFSTTANTRVNAICTDAAGNIYAAGETTQDLVIADGGHDNNFSGTRDAFLVKFSGSGTRQWGTYYGYNDGNTSGNACATDGSNNVYLLATTTATRFLATTGSHQSVIGGNSDAVLVKFDASGNRLWATFYGGSNNESGNALAVDNNDNVFIAGSTSSSTAIADGGHQNNLGGSSDAFLVKLNSNGSRQWGTYFGGTASDVAYGCATGSASNVYICGNTQSTTAIADGGHQNTAGGNVDGFLAKFKGTAINLPVTLTAFTAQCQPNGIELTWHTAQEFSNRHFEIQRYTAAGTWQTVTIVQGAGTTSQPSKYEWIDQNVSLGVQYYRLKQVDLDGKFTYSATANASCKANATLQFYPNPVVNGNPLQIQSPVDQPYMLITQQGQLLQSGQLQKGMNRLSLEEMPAGIYFLKTGGLVQRILVQ